MFIGIITLIGSITASMLLTTGILAGISLNPKVVKWYSRKLMGLMGDVAEEMSKDIGDMAAKLDSVKQDKA